MRKLKKSFMLVVCMLVLVCSTISVSAAELNQCEEGDVAVAQSSNDILPINTDDSSEYFNFVASKQRMSSDGSFTFSYSWSMESDRFKPADTSITVSATATSTGSNKSYSIALYKADGTHVKTVTYTADGTSYSYTFTGLSTTTRYYLQFTKPLGNTTITGSGKISSIK